MKRNILSFDLSEEPKEIFDFNRLRSNTLSSENTDFFRFNFSKKHFLLFFPIISQATIISKELYYKIFLKKQVGDHSPEIQNVIFNNNLNIHESLSAIQSLPLYTYDLFLDLTTDCNLHCKYCWSDHTTKHNATFEDIRPYLDFMLQLNQNRAGVNLFFMSSGESFLYWNLMKKIIEYVIRKKSLGFLHTITNGIVPTDILNEYHFKYMGWLSYSLDGPYEITSKNRGLNKDQFNLLIHNIRNSLSINKVSSLSAVITKHSLAYDVKSFLDFFQSLGGNFTLALRKVNIYDFNKNAHLLDIPYKEFSEFMILLIDEYFSGSFNFDVSSLNFFNLTSCKAKMMYSNAKIIQCQLFERVKRYEYTQYGVINKGVVNIQNSHLFDVFSYPFANDFFEEKCLKCPLKYWCGGGCPFKNLLLSGHLRKAYSEDCIYRLKLFKHILFKKIEQLLKNH